MAFLLPTATGERLKRRLAFTSIRSQTAGNTIWDFILSGKRTTCFFIELIRDLIIFVGIESIIFNYFVLNQV